MITRRRLLKTGAAGGMALAAPGLFTPALAQGVRLKIGYVSPQSGPLAGFAESDAFNIDAFLASQAGQEFEVIVRDSQSSPDRAAAVTRELIVRDEVNLIVVASTPETTNPVATTCEAEDMPCISTVAPLAAFLHWPAGQPRRAWQLATLRLCLPLFLGVVVSWALQTAFASDGSWYLFALGIIAIMTMLFAPRGLWGLLADHTGLALFPIQRRMSL